MSRELRRATIAAMLLWGCPAEELTGTAAEVRASAPERLPAGVPDAARDVRVLVEPGTNAVWGRFAFDQAAWEPVAAGLTQVPRASFGGARFRHPNHVAPRWRPVTWWHPELVGPGDPKAPASSELRFYAKDGTTFAVDQARGLAWFARAGDRPAD